MGKADKKIALKYWADFKPKRDAERTRHGSVPVLANDEVYKKLLSEARAKFSLPKSPAMPCFVRREASLEAITASQAKEEDNFGHLMASTKDVPGPRPHDQHVAPTGASSEEWFGLVHTPIDIPKALKIPEGREALEKEWAKLENPKRPAWDVSRVRPKAEVIAESERTGKPVHFGSLRDLCHIKNSQLGKQIWTYKG